MLLTGVHDGQQRLVVTAGRVIEDQLGAVGVHPPGGERVIQADLIVQLLDGRADALHRHLGLAQRAQYECRCEPDERDGCLPPRRWEDRDQRRAVLRECPRVQRRERGVQVGRKLVQREQRNRHATVTGWQRRAVFSSVVAGMIVAPAGVVPAPLPALSEGV